MRALEFLIRKVITRNSLDALNTFGHRDKLRLCGGKRHSYLLHTFPYDWRSIEFDHNTTCRLAFLQVSSLISVSELFELGLANIGILNKLQAQFYSAT